MNESHRMIVESRTSFAQHVLTLRNGDRIVTPCAVDHAAEAPPGRVKVTWPSGRTGYPMTRFLVRPGILAEQR